MQICMQTAWGSCEKADSNSLNLRWDLRVCISNRPLDDADTPGPRTTLEQGDILWIQ